jgi:hypothetical protein
MNGRPSFEPYDFLGRLKRDEIFVPIVIYGMVKPAEDNDDYLLFAHGNACKNWFRIPLSSIENISVLRFVPCDDHKHPLVSLVLKQPETEEGQLFVSLFQATSARARNQLSTPRQRRYNRAPFEGSRPRLLAQDHGVPHGPPAGDLNPSCEVARHGLMTRAGSASWLTATPPRVPTRSTSRTVTRAAVRLR